MFNDYFFLKFSFLVKCFSSFHKRVRHKLQQCLEDGFIHCWMTERRMLLQKLWIKVNKASNYRTKACSSLVWKIMTSIMTNKIYGHFDQQNLLLENQKGYRKRSRGTNDKLYIDREIRKVANFSRKKNKQ